jgi:hypothetical protein
MKFKRPIKCSVLLVTLVFLYAIQDCTCEKSKQANVEVYSAPESEKPSDDYRVHVNDQEVFCYECEVYDTRFTEGKFYGEKGLSYSIVAFAYFDFSGRVKISIKVNRNIHSAVIRPLSRNITPVVKENTIEFEIDQPGPLTIEPDGIEKRVLHIFANPMQQKPDINDENIIYYGPGDHVVNTIKLKSNQTLFIDGGAILYFDAFENDKVYHITGQAGGTIQLKRYYHAIEAVHARNIKIKGRGIVDFSRIIEKYGRKDPIKIINCENVEIEGIILRRATCWHATIYRSKNVTIDNMKEISCGYNSDGINILLSQDVYIKNCFMRQRDDGIVMKSMDIRNLDASITEAPKSVTSTSNVLVENCVIWSDWGYALGITYEIRMPVKDITFRNCEIIHATHATEAQGVLGILVSDSSSVSNVKFENITIERSLKPLIKLDQRLTGWTKNKNLGQIHDVTFSNIRYLEGDPQPIIFDCSLGKGNIYDIYLRDLKFLGKKIEDIDDWEFKINKNVEDVYINGKKQSLTK